MLSHSTLELLNDLRSSLEVYFVLVSSSIDVLTSAHAGRD